MVLIFPKDRKEIGAPHVEDSKLDQLHQLEDEVQVEERAVSLAHARPHPRAVVVVRAHAPPAVTAVLRADGLVQPHA